MPQGLRAQLFILNNLIWVIVIGFFLVNVIFTTNFFSYANVINILYHSAIMSMLVLGQGLVMMSGRLDLSLESTLVFAPGIAMLLTTKWIVGGLDPVLAIFVTLLLGALVGMFNGIFIAKLGVNHFLHTLAMMILLRGLAYFLLPFALFRLDPVYTWVGSARVFGDIPVAVFLMLFIFLVFHFIMQYTTFGRHFVATGGNPKASFMAGIKTDRILISAFTMAGFLAAIAGLMATGRQDSIASTMGEGMVLLSFAGALLGGASLSGGKGTPLGFLGGALLLGMFTNALNLQGVEVTLVYATKGALIFVAILLDRGKEKFRGHLLHQEQVRKLKLKEAKATSS